MKTKKFDKKLGLSKKTIANLTRKGMREVKGGERDTACTFCLYTCTGLECTIKYCDTEIMSACP